MPAKTTYAGAAIDSVRGITGKGSLLTINDNVMTFAEAGSRSG